MIVINLFIPPLSFMLRVAAAARFIVQQASGFVGHFQWPFRKQKRRALDQFVDRIRTRLEDRHSLGQKIEIGLSVHSRSHDFSGFRLC